jgi:ABC-type branched-subunit amino acid transport system permease subunit
MQQVIANGLYLGAQYALIALGLTLIFGLMNVLNFAHGQMYVLGGFITVFHCRHRIRRNTCRHRRIGRALSLPHGDQAKSQGGKHHAAGCSDCFFL